MLKTSQSLDVAPPLVEGAPLRVIIEWTGLIVVGQVQDIGRDRQVVRVGPFAPAHGSWVEARYPGEFEDAAPARWQVVHVSAQTGGYELVLQRGHVTGA